MIKVALTIKEITKETECTMNKINNLHPHKCNWLQSIDGARTQFTKKPTNAVRYFEINLITCELCSGKEFAYSDIFV